MIHAVLGTRAQLIKMAPVLRALRELDAPYRLILTGQHSETMDAMLDDFGLERPDVVLHDGPEVSSVARVAPWAARLLQPKTIEKAFENARDGVVLVHGDTFSTVLGALMGRRAGLRVAHVESGLRSFRWLDPFPEELNRLVTFRLSQVLYCPGEWAVGNVDHLEGKEVVDTTCNTLVDALRLAVDGPKRITLPGGGFGICTLHRYENVFRRRQLERLVRLASTAADEHRLLFVLHPPTARNLDRFGLREQLESHPNVETIPRLPYVDFVQLLARAEFVMTDGGSNQEETSYLGTPCLVMRRATERKEGLGANAVLSELRADVVARFLEEPGAYRRPPSWSEQSPSRIIAEHLVQQQ